MFLGCPVSDESYTMDPVAVAPVQALKERVPTAVGDLRKMLGFRLYYRSYIPSQITPEQPSSSVSCSVNLLTKQEKVYHNQRHPTNTPLHWTQSHQETPFLTNCLSRPSWDTQTSHSLPSSILMHPRMDQEQFRIFSTELGYFSN